MNVKRLKQARALISKECRQFVMHSFFDHDNQIYPKCGTAACIGGWGITLAARSKRPVAGWCMAEKGASAFQDACDAYEISQDAGRRLFVVEHWPAKFGIRYPREETVSNARLRARIAAARINHFIKTGGAE